MGRLLSWVVAFGRFWYDFIVGDDWTVAAAVAVGLVITAVLNARGVTAWWLVPVIVIAVVGVSLRRARSSQIPHPDPPPPGGSGD